MIKIGESFSSTYLVRGFVILTGIPNEELLNNPSPPTLGQAFDGAG